MKYLGYTFYKYKGKCRFRVHPKSVKKMKKKLRELTDRNNGMSNQLREEKYQQFVRGWINYFKLADMKSILKTTDEWARRRIRAVYWKQWKKTKTKYRMLKALGCEHWKAKELACSRKGYWRMAQVRRTRRGDPQDHGLRPAFRRRKAEIHRHHQCNKEKC